MIYLKKVNEEDIDEEYNAIKKIPANENGFVNKHYNVTKDEFINQVIPELLNHSNGIGLTPGHVPDTYFFLWDDKKIVGLFKIRHYLNDSLRKGAGHIGFCILPEYRGKGYAKQGLLLAIEKCKEIIKEDEIYFSVHKNNPASLKVQLDCGAYITDETEEEYLTRIKLNNHNIKFDLRNLKRNDWKRLIEKRTIVKDEKNSLFEGKVCYLEMQKVSSPLIVSSPIGKVTIANKNYKNLIFAPKNKNWWLTVMFDDEDNIIESYFDITKTNDFSNPENPYFIDMKLDICIPYQKEPTIMDEEELQTAFTQGLITKKDYDIAYLTANKIIEFYNLHKEEYYHYIYEMYNNLKRDIVHTKR